MQKLLTEAFAIPSVLRAFDLLSTRSPNATAAQSHSVALSDVLQNILRCLRTWKDTYERDESSGVSQGLSRPINSAHFGLGGNATCLWFENVATANAMTYYWAFSAICLVHVQKLQILETDEARVVPSPAARQQYIDPLVMILRSLPFLSQESHKLYGSSSVFFPLATVLEILSWDEQVHGSRVSMYQELMAYAKAQGTYSNIIKVNKG